MIHVNLNQFCSFHSWAPLSSSLIFIWRWGMIFDCRLFGFWSQTLGFLKVGLLWLWEEIQQHGQPTPKKLMGVRLERERSLAPVSNFLPPLFVLPWSTNKCRRNRSRLVFNFSLDSRFGPDWIEIFQDFHPLLERLGGDNFILWGDNEN
jgi:hypothetical protein